MNKILMTVQFAQDVDDKLGSDRTLGRQFWIATKTDVAWALDAVEIELAADGSIRPTRIFCVWPMAKELGDSAPAVRRPA